MRRAHEDGMHLACHTLVVEEPAGASQQSRILETRLERQAHVPRLAVIIGGYIMVRPMPPTIAAAPSGLTDVEDAVLMTASSRRHCRAGRIRGGAWKNVATARAASRRADRWAAPTNSSAGLERTAASRRNVLRRSAD